MVITSRPIYYSDGSGARASARLYALLGLATAAAIGASADFAGLTANRNVVESLTFQLNVTRQTLNDERQKQTECNQDRKMWKGRAQYCEGVVDTYRSQKK